MYSGFWSPSDIAVPMEVTHPIHSPIKSPCLGSSHGLEDTVCAPPLSPRNSLDYSCRIQDVDGRTSVARTHNGAAKATCTVWRVLKGRCYIVQPTSFAVGMHRRADRYRSIAIVKGYRTVKILWPTDECSKSSRLYKWETRPFSAIFGVIC